MRRPVSIAPPKGKLGVLTPGMGAVSTTLMAGVELVRRGESVPGGLAHADGDDPPGQAHRSARAENQRVREAGGAERSGFRRLGYFPRQRLPGAAKAGVLDAKDLAKAEKFLKTIKPMKAAFDQNYVKNLSGTQRQEGQERNSISPSRFARTFATSKRKTSSTAW